MFTPISNSTKAKLVQIKNGLLADAPRKPTMTNQNVASRGGVLEDVLGLGLEALGPQKLPCPRLKDSTIFLTVEILL